mgnify:CR=1 FL=1
MTELIERRDVFIGGEWVRPQDAGVAEVIEKYLL